MHLSPEEEGFRSREVQSRWTLITIAAAMVMTVIIWMVAGQATGIYLSEKVSLALTLGLVYFFWPKWANRILQVDQDEVVLAINPWAEKRWVLNGDGKAGTDPDEYGYGDHVIPPQSRDFEVISLKKDELVTGEAQLSRLFDDDNVIWKFWFRWRPNIKRLAYYKLLGETDDKRVEVLNKTFKAIIVNVIEMFCASRIIECVIDDNGTKEWRIPSFDELFDQDIRDKLLVEINNALTRPIEIRVPGKGEILRVSPCDDGGVSIVGVGLEDLSRSKESTQAIQAVGALKKYRKEIEEMVKEGVSEHTAAMITMATAGQLPHAAGLIVAGPEGKVEELTNVAKGAVGAYLNKIKKGGGPSGKS